MKATIKDVAKMANVSISTVSRAMNNPDIVAKDKLDKVLEAIEKLNYTPNALARGLIHKRTRTLGVLIPDISNLVYAELIRGMEDAAHESGNNLIICNTVNNQERRLSSLKVLSEKQIDGIVFTSEPVFPDSYQVFSQLGVPIVLAATHSLEYEIPSVKVNDEQAAFDAVQYLIRKGHCQIGMISGSMLNPISGLPRIQGFLRALRTHGIDLESERCIEHGSYHFEDGYEAVSRLHKKFPELTAIFATSDERALGCISYLHENQIKVPDEISVIGFDNTRMAGMCFPKLTTVAQPLYQMGYQAVQKLDRLINGEPLDELRTYMAHWIVERETVRDLGVRFDRYFCPAPQCSPSRASILSGLYPHNHGMIGLGHLGFSMNAGVTTLPKELQKCGYETALIGFSHETIDEPDSRLTSSTYKLGYERVLPVPGDRGPDVAERAVHYLQEKAASGEGKPFFASVGFFETHRDFDEYEDIADPIDKVVPPPYLPDTPQVREDFALLHGSVKVLDQSVGRILRSLEATGLSQNTLVIYTTDHGIAFPRAKGTLLDAGLETALVMYYPGRMDGGKVVDQLLCNVDLMPTLLDFVGADVPQGLDVTSFLEVQQPAESVQPTRDHFFSELTWHDQYHPMRAIRTERYKYIRNFEDGPAVYLPLDIHRSPSGVVVRDEYYVPNVPEELYDVEKDPLESFNLAGLPEYNDVLEELRQKVENWMNGTNDPLLKGRVAGIAAPEWQEQFDNGSAYSYTRKP